MGQDWHEPHAHLSLLCFGQVLGQMQALDGSEDCSHLKDFREQFWFTSLLDILNIPPFTQGADPKTSEEDQLQRTLPR